MSFYLVTGGAGFIGSNIVEELLNRGATVRVLDNFLTGKRENIASFLDKIDLIEGDIRDIKTCHDAVQGVDYVLHQAALPSVPLSLQDPVATTDININGTLNILIASRDAKVKKLVFASSSSVYGDEPTLPKEEGKEGKPLSPYAASKLACEKYCQVFSSVFGLSTISLRYFNVFVPRQNQNLSMLRSFPNSSLSCLKGSSLLFTATENRRGIFLTFQILLKQIYWRLI